ncbi:MAG: hypothetical protein AB7P07_08200 [Hyphomonadaceae bacterium]
MIRLFAAATLLLAAACSPPARDEAPVPIETAAPAAAPDEVLAVIRVEEAAFAPSAAVENTQTGARVFEVTGTGDGAPTYHVMHFNEGWRIVSVRRELVWGDAPQAVRDAVATSPQAIAPARVVEVREPGADGVMYELYNDPAGAPLLTVRAVDGEAAIMPAPH